MQQLTSARLLRGNHSHRTASNVTVLRPFIGLWRTHMGCLKTLLDVVDTSQSREKGAECPVYELCHFPEGRSILTDTSQLHA